jgi:hypothetical protein
MKTPSDTPAPVRRSAIRSRAFAFAPLLLLLLLLASPAPARDWIVNPETGADTNDGSVNAPLATAQAAVDKAGPGDRVVLLPAGTVYRQSIDLSKAQTGLVLAGNGVTLDGAGEREHGVFSKGNNRNVKVFDLAVRNCTGAGFAIGGECRGYQFFGILSSGNGGAGFAASDRAECWIREGNFERSAISFQSRDAAESYHSDSRFEGTIDIVGGRHSLTGCSLVGTPAAPLLSIQSNAHQQDGGSGAASLVIQSLFLPGADGLKPAFKIGPGSYVYHDAESMKTFERMDVSVHPSSELSESLYHTYPIGRDASGTPIMAWAGGGTRYLPSNAYRIIHFGKHVPQEVAPKLSPDNDWLGLLAPLDTAAFPPPGPAFAPEHSSAHAIWRWIGLAAPDAVFVPDTPEGRALGEALRLHPPAGIGMIDVFLVSAGRDGVQEMVVMPKIDSPFPSAKEEMLARVSRGPREVLHQIAAHYGDRFTGSYIEGLSIIARAEGGLTHRAAELAKAQLEAKPDLPKNGGEISGTLLHALIDEPWAKDRVLAVADMAFDDSGNPLEAMPTHNEMSDAIFMASPLLAHAGRISGEKRYFDAALRNFRFIAALCRRDDGIYRHSPLDEAAWGRGNGFPALGLALTLQEFPEDHEGYEEMRDALVAHLEALAKHQDNDGMWHQIIDHPDSYAELSSTAMIAYAIAVALDKGWIDEADWSSRLDAAWSAAKMYVSTNGRDFINVCTGTGKQKTLEDYYLREAILGPDGRGAAMMMLLSAKLMEMESR